MKFSIKDLFSKCDQICSFQRIWSPLLKKSLMENFIFCAVTNTELIQWMTEQSPWGILYKNFAESSQ